MTPGRCWNGTAVVLTYNEEANLPDCLRSLCDWVPHILIVDSGSTDLTRDIAQGFGAVVVEHPFETHAKQWHWALQNLPIRTEWILALDADQRVTPELAAEICDLDATTLDGLEGIYLSRRQLFRGRWIRHGGYYPKYLLKMFRHSTVSTDDRDLVDHHFYVAGHTTKLRHDLIEANSKEDEIRFWIEKHNRYARLLAIEEMNRRTGDAPLRATLFGSPDQRTLALKRLWFHLPLYLRPLLYFLYRYVLRLGFLDGKQGMIFHFLHAYWYRFLVDINLDEMRAQIQPPQKSLVSQGTAR